MRHALLVDDDSFALSVMSRMLTDLGVENVTTALSGSAGLVAFDRSVPAPDLVLCDLHMPAGDGFQFMEGLGARHFDGGVVLVSGMNDKVRRSASLMGRFYNLQLLANLNKPVDPDMLRHALHLD
jgi:CheY-like chemotaxis protein